MEIESKKNKIHSESGNKRVTRSSTRGQDPITRISVESKPIKKGKLSKNQEKKAEKPKETRKRGKKANGKENESKAEEVPLNSEVKEAQLAEKTPLKANVEEKTEKEVSTVKKDEVSVKAPRKTPFGTPLKSESGQVLKDSVSVKPVSTPVLKNSENPLKGDAAVVATPKKLGTEDTVDNYIGTGLEITQP